MSEHDPQYTDWHLAPAIHALTRWKWGWNAASGEATVWEVSGDTDGWPTHHDHLTAAWGREPNYAGGDIVGIAEHNSLGDGADAITIRAYGHDVPTAVLDRFRAAYPDLLLQPQPRPAQPA